MISLSQVTNLRLLSVLLVTLLFAWAAPALAANIYVDSTCTLQDAIKAANRDKEGDGCEAGDGDDVIIMTRDGSRHNTLRDVTSTITIRGGGYTFRMTQNARAFKIDGGELTIRDLRIEHQVRRKSSVFEVDDGELTLVNVTATNCDKGIKLDNSHVNIHGHSNICGLAGDELISGSGTSNINLPQAQAPNTCGDVPANVAVVTATYGLASGIQCQQVDGGGIGVQSIVDAGFIAAVNLWGYVEQGVEVCFQQLGSLVFLDSATSPRTVAPIAGYIKGNSACANLTRAGTIVLMPGAPPTAVLPVVSEPVDGQPTVSQPAIVGCPIHTTGHLRLRGTPSLQGETLGYVPRGSNLNSPSRTTFWYQVSYRGLTGWIGHKYVRASC